jgi:pyrroloquinoline quinone biosynthesis protein E
VANVQYYGWAFLNRDHLLPSREQVLAAKEIALAATQKYQGRMEIIYVLPDLYESRPKPCMHGWGRRYLTVRPNGEVLPCPTASAIPDLEIETVRNKSLRWIWNDSPGFNRLRGTDWLPEPCQSCAFKEVDFGGCRCQAALLAGNAAATDPVCTLSPHRRHVDAILAATSSAHADGTTPSWTRRTNPATIGNAVC